jgi:protein subunit release factor A
MKNSILDPRLLQRLNEADVRLREVDEQLAMPGLSGDLERLRSLGQERAELEPVARTAQEIRRLLEEYESAGGLAEESGDPRWRLSPGRRWNGSGSAWAFSPVPPGSS